MVGCCSTILVEALLPSLVEATIIHFLSHKILYQLLAKVSGGTMPFHQFIDHHKYLVLLFRPTLMYLYLRSYFSHKFLQLWPSPFLNNLNNFFYVSSTALAFSCLYLGGGMFERYFVTKVSIVGFFATVLSILNALWVFS